jgi:predicted  nucleic acid-binding Zn-ribbon protein
MELNAAKEAVQSYATAVEAMGGSLQQVTGKAEGLSDAIQNLQGHVKAQQDSVVEGVAKDCQRNFERLGGHCASLTESIRSLEGQVQDSHKNFGQYRERVDGALQKLVSGLQYSRDDIEQVHALMQHVQQAWDAQDFCAKASGGLRRKNQQGQRQPISLLSG